MVPLPMLGTPILVSAVVVFIASAIVWMVLPHHRNDWKQLPDEEAVIAALQSGRPAPGQYLIPFVRGRRMSDETRALMEQGRAGILVVRRPGKMGMGKPLVGYFIYTLVISLFVAYVTGRTNSMGQDYLQIFRVAGTAAILAYAGAVFPASIWFSRPWSVTLKDAIDGIVYGLLTAGVFGWLWPR